MERREGNVFQFDAQTVRHRLMQRGLFELAVEVAERHKVPVLMLLGRGRTKSEALARRELYAVLRQRALSYPEIGMLLGRDHSTVIVGVQQYQREQPPEPVEKVRVAV
jgi:chromosomal replication initiation ATPase DnaA